MNDLKEVDSLDTVGVEERKKEQDRKSILDLAGKFHVTFDFAETFSPQKEYKREGLYTNGSVEYIFVIKDEANLISLQHILVINERFVVKHWRQDWVYENQEFLLFDKEGVWKRKTISKEEAKGTWTQRVYQVDDSPRYQGYGTWVYVDGKRYWESIADAPLPRRQETRTDYNVLIRNSRININNEGWLMDQNNQKVFRNENGEDQLIVWEKGIENQLRGDYNIQPAIEYWEKHQAFWADVRTVWDEALEGCEEVRIKEKIGEKHLYDKVFAFAQQFSGDNYNQQEVRKEISNAIAEHRFK